MSTINDNTIIDVLNKTGVTKLWNKVKSLTTPLSNTITAITNSKGAANGIATLDANSKLTTSQLPTLKTINGNSIIGSGNITLDLSLYNVVTTLPLTNPDPNKIYLVLTGGGPEGNIYTEYIYVNAKWEELGKYSAAINLEPYIEKSTKGQANGVAPLNANAKIDNTYLSISPISDTELDEILV